MIEEMSWYVATDETGIYRQILDGDYFKTFHSIEELREAIDRRAKGSKYEHGKTYLFCKVNFRKHFDENGNFLKQEEITEVVERYTIAKEGVA